MDKLIKMKRVAPLGFFKNTTKTIKWMTEVTNDHFLTPELFLRLVTPRCPLWTANYEECPYTDPFWAFYWPGGEALTRYILDNRSMIKGKSVLDIGSGCGSLAIVAAKFGGAKSVTANDIDPIAAVAIKLNASLNHCPPNNIHILTSNLIGETLSPNKYDCVLLGDMFYNEQFNDKLINWLHRVSKTGAEIFIGDPNRHSKFFEEYKNIAGLVAKYEVPDEYIKINDLKTNTINVWKLKGNQRTTNNNVEKGSD